jgi:transcription elongation factor GreA
MQQEPMTNIGYKNITNELEFLKNSDRPNTLIALEEARQLGDLKENAEYHAEKDKLKLIDIQIATLQDTISKAIIIDPKNLPHIKISFGSTIKLLDIKEQKEFKYHIVGSVETDPNKGLISFNSPLAKQLIGKEEGDEIVVNLPDGKKEFEVLDVYYEKLNI